VLAFQTHTLGLSPPERNCAENVEIKSTSTTSLNYFASYAPVAGASTIKAQVVHGKLNEHILESWDYSSAYLQATIEENIEVRLPGDPNEYGLSIPRGSQIKLSKSIYGLVQAGNAWNKLLTESLGIINFSTPALIPKLNFS
jgi:hypothetical protein